MLVQYHFVKFAIKIWKYTKIKGEREQIKKNLRVFIVQI